MAIIVNLRHLEQGSKSFAGELGADQLGFESLDELIHPAGPLRYEFDVERQGRSLLLQGSLALSLQCECARCLRSFPLELCLDSWTALLPLEGEDPVTVHNDCVDLTPYVREDMVLALPQRPLCKPECAGLVGMPVATAQEPSSSPPSAESPSAWQELDKLRF